MSISTFAVSISTFAVSTYILYSSEVFLYSIFLLVLHKTVPLQDCNTMFTRAIHTHNDRESKESYQNHEWLKYIIGLIKPPSMEGSMEGAMTCSNSSSHSRSFSTTSYSSSSSVEMVGDLLVKSHESS